MTEHLPRLDLFQAPLDAVNLIEASAGTGKTYTIAGLYLRLVVEAGQPVNRILVVTYTKAATEELRNRIRRRLVAVREVLVQGAEGDDFCQRLLGQCRRLGLETGLLQRRLINAIRGFDEAAIFTIHGFCQRVLADCAFEGGVPFEAELLTDQRELLQEIVDDFWRLEFYQASPLLVAYLLDQGYSPERLLAEISPYLGKPYLHVLGPDEATDFAGAEQAFASAYGWARALWRSRRHEVMELLGNSASLNGNQYRKASMPGWFEAMTDYLDSEAPNPSLFKSFHKFTARQLAASVKKAQIPPRHPFFAACDELQDAHVELAARYQAFFRQGRIRLLAFCDEQLARRKRRLQLQSYDDLLLSLQAALASERGEELAETLRRRYSCALIDEFQDTDPVQYDIFRRLYGDTSLPVFLVGDPKQAIYSFRGADIFTYLSARREATRRYTLDVNWRSSPGLIEGLNALIGRAPRPFLFETIPFQRALAADQERETLAIQGRSERPLQLWLLAGEDQGISKAQASALAVRATAAEIAHLLALSQNGQAHVGERPLEGGDIAVLVRTHRQGRLLREGLLRLGIPSVQRVQDNVFDSPEAQQLEWLLLAVAEPAREQRVRAALVSDLLGLSGEDLYRLIEAEQRWEERLEDFHEYHVLWREHGFMRMFMRLLLKEEVPRRLLSFRDGERRLTNLLHLAELLQTQSGHHRTGMEGLIKWLSQQRRSSAGGEEERQLRLESDEHLVNIVTVHKSKGLEYPIVFCPFLWDGGLKAAQRDAFSFHDPGDPTRVLLDLGSPQREEHLRCATKEEAAENLRLLYVALTRAKHRCYLNWGTVNEAETSALAWLLREPSRDFDNMIEPKNNKHGHVGQVGYRGLREVADRVPRALSLSPLPADTGPLYRPALRQSTPAVVRQLRRTVPGGWQVGSFTALTVGRADELPDHDVAVLTGGETEGVLDGQRNMFAFPRGARAGICLHLLFERLDFAGYDRDRIASLVAKALEEAGFAADWTTVVAAMVEKVLAVPLEPGGCCLREVVPGRRLNELEFYYPLAGLTPEGLRRLLQAHGFAGSAGLARNLAFDFNPIRGYMKGFIDLVFESGGRFYLVDYKSNWLGERYECYRSDKLAEVMLRESYHLQYLIYTLALHRYLGWRLPDYDYDRHFGAVYYLFLRGIDPDLGPEYGIYRDRPARALIEALDDYLQTGTIPAV